MSYSRNSEGYHDPTAGAACGHILRDERRKRIRQLRQAKSDSQAAELRKSLPPRYVNVSKNRRHDV